MMDFLEIASYVFTADCSTERGKWTDEKREEPWGRGDVPRSCAAYAESLKLYREFLKSSPGEVSHRAEATEKATPVALTRIDDWRRWYMATDDYLRGHWIRRLQQLCRQLLEVDRRILGGAGKSPSYRQSLREFWIEYFGASGARLESYTVLRDPTRAMAALDASQ
jgi:hypothetical protein